MTKLEDTMLFRVNYFFRTADNRAASNGYDVPLPESITKERVLDYVTGHMTPFVKEQWELIEVSPVQPFYTPVAAQCGPRFRFTQNHKVQNFDANS